MKTQTWQQVQKIFELVCDLPAGERVDALAEACDGDEKLIAEVNSLLSYHDQADSFLEAPALSQFSEVIAEKGTEFGAPETIGPYRILKTLGKGGMGSVYEAEREKPFKRKVALKVIYCHADNQEFIRRFQAEHQALALMNHHNIAHVYEAGQTDGGMPYFTMEFVEGEEISAYCDHHGLSFNQRLDLFLQVCEGISHAHRRGIIHRDLKPSNVLVKMEGGKPVPKIIDFGVAKILDETLPRDGRVTIRGTIMGTPAYMSPEQAQSRDIDTRTDVYALGIMLYELLAGVLPFEEDVYYHGSLNDVLRLVLDRDPPRPSQRFLQLEDEQDGIAKMRQLTPSAMEKALRGDLDWIIMKAIEKDRSRRFGSVGEFSADVMRHMHQKPVEARPPSMSYVLGKFVRRHKPAVALASITMFFVLAGVALLGFSTIKISDAELKARTEAGRVKQINAFFLEVLEGTDPWIHGGRPTVSEALERASTDLSGLDDPETKANLRATLGRIYNTWWEFKKALTYLDEAIALKSKTLSEDDNTLLSLRYERAVAIYRLDELKTAEKELIDLVAIRERVSGETHSHTFRVKRLLADVYAGQQRNQEALELFQSIYDKQKQYLGELDPETMVTLKNMAQVNLNMGKSAEAEILFREVVEKRIKKFGDKQHNQTLSAMNGLAIALFNLGKYEEAESLAREVYSLRLATYGEESPPTLEAANILSLIFSYTSDAEKLVDAEDFFRRILKARTKAMGENHSDTLLSMNNLADCLIKQGKLAEAGKIKEREIQIRIKRSGDNHPDTLYFSLTLAEVYQKEGRLEDAAQLFQQIVQKMTKELPANDTRLALAKGLYGACLKKMKQPSRAEELINESLTILENAKSSFADYVRQALADIN